MTDPVLIPGDRDVRGSLEAGDAKMCVVACPPHPQYGGNRRDGRLRALSSALADRDIACLRFDYGPWADGAGEQLDVDNTVAWANGRFETVGLFGYSFGGAMVLLVAPTVSIGALSVLAPTASVSGLDADVVVGVEAFCGPIQVIYGTRDTTVDSTAIAERARELGHTVVEFSADHFFIGNESTIGETVADFFVNKLSA